MWLVGTFEVPGNLPIRLEAGDYLIGRSNRAQIVIVDATVSRRHARLIVGSGAMTLEDMGSSNGTRVNECPVARCELHVGDHVRFGSVGCAVSSSPLLVRALDENYSTFQVHDEGAKTAPVEGLTAAQMEVVNHILAGRSETEIAKLLDKSPHTIHTHLKAIFHRLEVHSRAELIMKLLGRPRRS